jgi:hypothetical protein
VLVNPQAIGLPEHLAVLNPGRHASVIASASTG